MDANQISTDVKTKLQSALDRFMAESAKLRTGRAHPSMLDGVTVEAYGTPMPLNQVATVTAPEAQLIQISPFDPNNLEAISAAIRDNQSLGLNPSDDGRLVRVPIPALNEERRREIVKLLGEKLEESMIAMRQARHDGLKAADQAKKDKSMSEDDVSRVGKQIDELMTDFKAKAEEAAKSKEADIMTV